MQNDFHSLETSKKNTYEERIAALLATYVLYKEADALQRLLAAMGCETMHWSPTDNFKVVAAEKPDGENEAFICHTLVTVARLYLESQSFDDESNMSLISGFSKANRLAATLQGSDEALDLALLLLMLSSSAINIAEEADDFANAFLPAATSSACALLNAWLQPAIELVTIPTGSGLVRMLFNEIWCAVEPALDMEISDLYEAVRLCRPPFIEGLVPAGVETRDVAIELPTMGTS
jgi:hypothetical protein